MSVNMSRDELLASVRVLIENQVKHWKKALPWLEYDEVFNEAMGAVLTAAKHFDPSRGEFDHLVSVAIRHRMIVVRNWHHKREKFFCCAGSAFSNSTPEAIQLTRELTDKLPGPLATSEAKEIMDIARVALADRPEWFEAMYDRICKGRRLREIGERIGVTKERARQIINLATEQVRCYMKIKQAVKFRSFTIC